MKREKEITGHKSVISSNQVEFNVQFNCWGRKEKN